VRRIELEKSLVHTRLKRKGANDFQLWSLRVFGSSARGAGEDKLFELGYSSRNAGADGAEGDLEDIRNLLIGRVVQVEQGSTPRKRVPGLPPSTPRGR
jgi:hypothetical protein